MRPTLLVVDDEPSVQKLVQRIGTKIGFRVVSALSLEEGLRTVVDTPPDIVLVDMNLPDGTGSQLIRRLRDAPDMRRIPIVLWSGDEAAAQREAERHAGGVAWVPKADITLLMSTLRGTLLGNENSAVVPVARVVEPSAEQDFDVLPRREIEKR
jgi:CheY-like chemotaxis protein